MINPDTIAVDIAEQQEWLTAYKGAHNFSWRMLGELIGLPQGTLSNFHNPNYGGKKNEIAEAVFRYRQTLESREARERGLISAPGYFETPTSLRLIGLLSLAHTGRITVAATSPGTGKTVTTKEYAARGSNVWTIRMRESTKSVSAMTMLVLRALGVAARGGWGSQMSDLVIDRVRNRRGLLIVDESNHLSLGQFEEIRAWHDETEVGVCFLGNEGLLQRIVSGPQSDAFARLHSRIASSHEQQLPVEGDVVAFCDAWGIDDAAMRALLKRIALTPAAGGLRECAQIVEQASMAAADEHRPLSFADLQEAKATRATRHIN